MVGRRVVPSCDEESTVCASICTRTSSGPRSNPHLCRPEPVSLRLRVQLTKSGHEMLRFSQAWVPAWAVELDEHRTEVGSSTISRSLIFSSSRMMSARPSQVVLLDCGSSALRLSGCGLLAARSSRPISEMVAPGPSVAPLPNPHLTRAEWKQSKVNTVTGLVQGDAYPYTWSAINGVPGAMSSAVRRTLQVFGMHSLCLWPLPQTRPDLNVPVGQVVDEFEGGGMVRMAMTFISFGPSAAPV